MGLFGKRRENWPSVVVQIDEWDRDEAKATVSGCFTVNGEFYSVVAAHEFAFTRKAEEFIAKVEGNPTLVVRYNPDDPTDNIPEDFM